MTAPPDWDALADQGRQDPYFFAKAILGYDKLQKALEKSGDEISDAVDS